MEKISTQIPKFLLCLTCFFAFSVGGFSQNKSEFVKKVPTSKQVKVDKPVSSKTDPSAFPKYVNTGDAQADRDRYKQAKLDWIARNPQKYEEMKPRPKTEISRSDFERLPQARQKQIESRPDRYKIKED